MQGPHIHTIEHIPVRFPIRLKKDSRAPKYMTRLGYSIGITGLLLLVFYLWFGLNPWNPFMLLFLLTIGIFLFLVLGLIAYSLVEGGRSNLGTGFTLIEKDSVRFFEEDQLVKVFEFDSKTIADVRLSIPRLGIPAHPTALMFKNNEGKKIELGIWEGYESNAILEAWYHFLAIVRSHNMKGGPELVTYLRKVQKKGEIYIPRQ